MNLIPAVKNLEIHEGFLESKVICYDEDRYDSRLTAALKKLCPDQKSSGGKPGTQTDILILGETGEGYELSIGESWIRIEAQGPAGAFYGIQTLRQLFKQDRIPCLRITDWPDFAYRGFYQDVTRGKIPTVETIKKLIDRMAYYKLNSLQLYVEHVFEFEETEELIKTTGYLTKEEIREIGRYCRENFIEFIPSLSTFGHMYELLQQRQYRHLRVLKDYQEIPNFWDARMSHHTIDPLNKESIRLVKSLIDQYSPHFDSQWFNICCDETFDLTRYGEEGRDVGKIYVDFVKEIVSCIRQKNKKVMMWADILLQYPEAMEELPEDILFLNWHYSGERMEEKISRFARLGRKQIVCSGTNSWNRLCENVEVEEANIAGMAEWGQRYGAVGLLNTNWGDWGNPCSLELAMYGMVLGAEKSWSVKTKADGDFDRRVNALLYENEKGIGYLRELSRLHCSVGWRQLCQNYFKIRSGRWDEASFLSAEETEKVQKNYLAFAENLSGEVWGRDEYRQEMLLCAEGLCVMAELSAMLAGNPLNRVSDTREWMCRYRKKWLEKNKESELGRIEEMFAYCETEALRRKDGTDNGDHRDKGL